MSESFSRRTLLGAAATLALIAGGLPALAQSGPGPLTLSPAATPKAKDDVTALNAFLEEVFEAGVSLSPEMQTYLGRKTNYDRWDDDSDAFAALAVERTRTALKLLRQGWDPARLPPAAKLNYRLFENRCELEIAALQWRPYGYPLNHLGGRHTGIPSFLANAHDIADIGDARAYLARLEGIPRVIQQTIDRGYDSAAKGIIPPKFSLTKMRPDIRSVITGAPFNGGADSALYADFKGKVTALDIPQADKDKLVAEAARILVEKVKPAYEALDVAAGKLEAQATQEDGVWKLPDGATYYRFVVKQDTTTDLTPNQIHELGLKHVAELQKEMQGIMRKVEFKGTLPEFFHHLRTDPKFYFSNDDAGRAAYLAHCEKILAEFTARLDEWFITKPKAPLVVKRVEAYREKSAPPAFYNQPSPDGSRPGIFYANLADMREMAKWQSDAIVYHEGIPGHHMQIAIAQELGDDVPSFRRFGFYGAYTEGWGLYSEMLPKEQGFYQDPYADFGRLTTQIWRAVRLVVDSGIHAKKWTREQAVDYFVANTPLNRDQVIREVDRYIVNPGQATSYYVGMLRIMELRDKARRELGAKFDLKGFHEVVLRTGAVPLDILGEQVDAWIASVK